MRKTMDSDGSSSVVLTVATASWRGACHAQGKLGVSDTLDASEVHGVLGALADRIIEATLEAAAVTAWAKTGEVSLLLTDDREIRSLNKTYRARDQATNVLSFPGQDLIEGKANAPRAPGPVLLGDIAISFERLQAEASEQEKELVDHFAHLLVHGTLHLLGYDHGHDTEASVMEGLEASILKTLGFAAPYAPFAGEDSVRAAQ